METLGQHIIAELEGCAADLLSDAEAVRRLLREVAERAHAMPVAQEVFDAPQGGVSGFILLDESHIAIHTWPEYRYAAVDLYTRGRQVSPRPVCDYLGAQLGASEVRTLVLDRGKSGRGAIPEPHFHHGRVGTEPHPAGPFFA